MIAAPVETFSALSAVLWLRHAFLLRVPSVDVLADRATVLERLQSAHDETLAALGLDARKQIGAEQIHGAKVVRVDATTFEDAASADGLLTDDPAVCLRIYVADCGAIFLIDRRRKALGLLHSGKKGTELEILPKAINRMNAEFGTEPADLLVQLGPCIRPPFYEINFAAEIGQQAKTADVGEFHDCGANTASDPERYYSYRREMGRTGRHLAVLALT